MPNCKICQNPISNIMSFGKMPIANHFLTQEEFTNEYLFDLSTAFCEQCKMFQLIEQPAQEIMFHESYAFFSSTSKRMEQHFEQTANHYLNDFISDPSNAFVVELGSNDGIMLKHFAKKNIAHLGIEPSKNVAKVASNQGVNTITRYFDTEVALEVVNKYGKADVVSAANVMCHIPNLNSVGKGISYLLKSKGTFVFEDPYLGDMISNTAYDQIYDEHVYIFSVHSVISAFKSHGLEVFDIQPLKTHGGSMRYYLCHEGEYQPKITVYQQLEKEKKIGLDKLSGFRNFIENCEKNKSKLVQMLQTLKLAGKRVVGYAATSKSTTILNYCKIGPDLIEYICDTTPIKQNKYSPGMHIPIKPHEIFKANYPDYAVLFAWNHATEIFEKEQPFIENGGKWIVFVPRVEIIETCFV